MDAKELISIIKRDFDIRYVGRRDMVAGRLTNDAMATQLDRMSASRPKWITGEWEQMAVGSHSETIPESDQCGEFTLLVVHKVFIKNNPIPNTQK